MLQGKRITVRDGVCVDDLGVLVSRAHHADVGGMWPGSLPAASTELFQEGLVIPPLPLTDEVLRLMLADVARIADAHHAALLGFVGRRLTGRTWACDSFSRSKRYA